MIETDSVSVVIPCLNEEKFIGRCLDSVLENDYPKHSLEILVIDGFSQDSTRKIVEDYSRSHQCIKLLDNPKRITPAALNIGIKAAQGEIIVRMDAHSTYNHNYISKCVSYLKEYQADNVGGIWTVIPQDDSFIAQAITTSLSNSFGVGNAHYRTGGSTEPKWVDTVPYGCFRKELFENLGYFDENSPRNEDIEFNARLRKAGGKILLAPEIIVNYFARSSFRTFSGHNFKNGIKVTRHFTLRNNYFSWRHLIPFLFVLGLLAFLVIMMFSRSLGAGAFWIIAGPYCLLSLYFSTDISLDRHDVRYLFFMPLIFASLHIAYGLGSLWGLLTYNPNG